ALGLVPAAGGLDRARSGAGRRAYGVGGEPAKSWLLEVLCIAAAEAAGVESQAHLPRVQGASVKPASRGEASSSGARACGALRTEATGHGLVGGLHVRCSGLWPALPDVQCAG